MSFHFNMSLDSSFMVYPPNALLMIADEHALFHLTTAVDMWACVGQDGLSYHIIKTDPSLRWVAKET